MFRDRLPPGRALPDTGPTTANPTRITSFEVRFARPPITVASFLWLGMAVGLGFGDSGCPIRVNGSVSNCSMLGHLLFLVSIPILLPALLSLREGGWARTNRSLTSGLILCIGGFGLIAYMDASLDRGCAQILEGTFLPTGGLAGGIVILVLTVRSASRLSRKPS